MADDVEVHGRPRKKICVKPYLGAQVSHETSPEIALPDELWALIFSKMEDGWRQASRLACLCRQFARVLDVWKSTFARRVSFNCQARSRSPKVFVRMARTFGEHVRVLKVFGAISSGPVGDAPRHCLENALQYMPQLEELDASNCLLAGGSTLLSVLLDMETLRDVQLSVTVSKTVRFPIPKFVFSSTCRTQLERLSRKCSLSLAFVAIRLHQADTIRYLCEDAGRGLAEQLTSLEVPNSIWHPGLCGTVPGCVQPPGRAQPPSTYSRDAMFGLPFPRHEYKRLCRLVVYGFSFASSDLLERLRNCPLITHLNVATTIDKGQQQSFFAEFSSLPNKLVHLNTTRWSTFAGGDTFAEMARHFPTLREFSFQCLRRRRPPCVGGLPETAASPQCATLLVDACPNLTALSVGTDMGVPGLDEVSRNSLYMPFPGSGYSECDFGPIPALRALANLRSLSLTSVNLQSVNDIRLLAQGCPQLEEFKLCALGTSPAPYIPGLPAALQHLTLLRTLAVADLRFRMTGFFEELRNLQYLESLTLFTKEQIADKVLVEYFKSTAAPLDFVHITCDGLKKGLCALVKTLHSMRPRGKVLVRHAANRDPSYESSHGFKWDAMWIP